MVAFFVGLIIGLERQVGQHPAGLRTNTLVSLGAALFTSLSISSTEHADPTRVAAQVVSGLGFLGGGIILREGLNVRGLNTAATLWCSGAVGTLAGLGHIKEAIFGTSLIVVSNLCLRPLSSFVDQLSKVKGNNDGHLEENARSDFTSSSGR